MKSFNLIIWLTTAVVVDGKSELTINVIIISVLYG